MTVTQGTNVSHADEQEQLRQLVRRFLLDTSPMPDVRRLIEAGTGRDDRVWKRMAEQLGLQGLAIPTEYGGVGGGPVELGIVLEEMGRALFVAPYFSTVALAAQALLASDDESARRRWLPEIADGSLTASAALAEESGSWDPAAVRATARLDGGDWRLAGSKHFVVDGCSADLLLVSARVDDGLGLFAVSGTAVGVQRHAMDALDLTRQLASVSFTDASAIRVEVGDMDAWSSTVLDLALAASAAEQIGGAAACLDLAVEYAKIREQFNRPIGSFQAIKHKCAALLVEIESGRSAVYAASAAVAEPGAEASIAASVAKAYCSQAFTHAAKECIQIHGGIGYTWEHDAHLYLRRAKSSELLLGSPAQHRARLADLVGI